MTEVERIVDQITRGFHKDAWHGLSVSETLEGVTAEQAAKRPIAAAHTIWELVHHVTAWNNIVNRRLHGDASTPTDEDDWPPVKDTSAAAWDADLRALKAAHDDLTKVVKAMTDAQLTPPLPGRDTSAYFQLMGVLQHDAYHTGQIVMLKKMM